MEDRIQQVMLHYRDTEAITFYLCLEPHQAGLGAKADVGAGVYACTATWPVAPHDDDAATREILAVMLEMAGEIRRERRQNAPGDPDVQNGQ